MLALNKKIVFSALLFIVIIVQHISFSRQEHAKAGITGVIHSDGFYYYQYLPEVILNGNVRHLPNNYQVENGNTLNKYTCGVSILQLPFFLVAHSYASFSKNSNDGYSPPYAYGLLLGAITYAFFGFVFLFKFLQKRFNTEVAWLSVLSIYLGTNIMHYIYAEPGMAHVYSFFCLSAVLFFTDRFYDSGRQLKYLILLSVLFSIAVLIRPTNIVFIFWLIAQEIFYYRSLPQSKHYLKLNLKFYLYALAAGFICFIPQLLYWHAVTGKWIVFSYGNTNEGFTNWKNPHLWSIFFGVRSGWLIYSPVMIFSIIGLIIMFILRKQNAVVLLLIFAAVSYLCASWWDPTFSCSCGYRSFIDFYPVFSISLAFLLHHFLNKTKKYRRIPVYLVLVLFVYTGLRLCLDYTAWPFCNADLTWDIYLDELYKISPVH